MRVFRSPRPTRYTVLDNRVIEDARLSWRALGLLTYLLSRPDGWDTDHHQLAKTRKEGEKAVLAALREIEAAGYLVRQRQQDSKTGRWSTDWALYDRPRRGP